MGTHAFSRYILAHALIASTVIKAKWKPYSAIAKKNTRLRKSKKHHRNIAQIHTFRSWDEIGGEWQVGPPHICIHV